jgi:hypothetical protein
MGIYPGLPEFKRLARGPSARGSLPRGSLTRGPSLVPISLECPADDLTPLSLFHSLYEKSRHSFLLESV